MPRKILGAILLVIVLLLIIVLRASFPEEYIQRALIEFGPIAPAVYVLLALFVNIFLPFLAPPVVYVGYYAFGRWVILYSSISSFLCFFSNFWIARCWGREIVQKLVGRGVMKKIDEMSDQYGVVTLFFLRVFQGGMHDIISYVGGLTDMKFVPYIVTSIVGLIPGAIFWYLISLYAYDSVSFFVVSTVMSVVLSIIFIGGTILIQKNKKNIR